MASEFITRVERDKDEPYTVIFRTDDADKYKHIEDACRRIIGHEKPTVDAVPVVRCKYCLWRHDDSSPMWLPCMGRETPDDWFCADGERRDDEQQSKG